MSVLIPGMEMPTNCSKCKLFGEYGCPFIGAVGYALTRGERNEDCPLIPVPKHGDLIDRDALMKQVEHDTPLSTVYEKTMRRYLNNAPTIIPAEEGEG